MHRHNNDNLEWNIVQAINGLVISLNVTEREIKKNYELLSELLKNSALIKQQNELLVAKLKKTMDVLAQKNTENKKKNLETLVRGDVLTGHLNLEGSVN